MNTTDISELVNLSELIPVILNYFNDRERLESNNDQNKNTKQVQKTS